MNYHILSLFPEMVMDGLNTSIIGRAVEKGLISIEAISISRRLSIRYLPGAKAYTGDLHLIMQCIRIS